MLHKGLHGGCVDCEDYLEDNHDDDENYDHDDDGAQVSGSTIVMTGGLDTEASVTEVFN